MLSIHPSALALPTQHHTQHRGRTQEVPKQCNSLASLRPDQPRLQWHLLAKCMCSPTP